MECHLAGRKYHDADLVWNELKVGTELQLELDTENRFDPNAVAVLYSKAGEEEPYLLGYIPRAENTPLAHLLEAQLLLVEEFQPEFFYLKLRL